MAETTVTKVMLSIKKSMVTCVIWKTQTNSEGRHSCWCFALKLGKALECNCEWILLQHVMLGQELDRPETWDPSTGTFQSKNKQTPTQRVQTKKQKKQHNLLNSLKTKCFSFIKPHSLIELQITLHILHVYKIHYVLPSTCVLQC